MANNNNSDEQELAFENENDANKQGDTNTGSNRIKDPNEWSTGDEPMTGAQRSYVQTLSNGKAGEDMTKAEAAKFIDAHKQESSGVASKDGGVSNAIKDPSDWVTGDEDMTDAQRSYLKTLSDEAGEDTDEELTKAEASKKIEELQHKTGRGAD